MYPLNMVIFHSYVSLPEGSQNFMTQCQRFRGLRRMGWDLKLRVVNERNTPPVGEWSRFTIFISSLFRLSPNHRFLGSEKPSYGPNRSTFPIILKSSHWGGIAREFHCIYSNQKDQHQYHPNIIPISPPIAPRSSECDPFVWIFSNYNPNIIQTSLHRFHRFHRSLDI